MCPVPMIANSFRVCVDVWFYFANLCNSILFGRSPAPFGEFAYSETLQVLQSMCTEWNTIDWLANERHERHEQPLGPAWICVLIVFLAASWGCSEVVKLIIWWGTAKHVTVTVQMPCRFVMPYGLCCLIVQVFGSPEAKKSEVTCCCICALLARPSHQPAPAPAAL